MIEKRTFDGGRFRGGFSRLVAGGAAAAFAIAAYGLPVWIGAGQQAQAQTGIGVGGGSAAATLSGEMNALGVPGGTASVAFALTSEGGEAAAIAMDVVYDSTFVDIDDPGEACQLVERLEEQSISARFALDQPDPPLRRLRIGVFPPITTPVEVFADGDFVECDFSVAANAPLNEVIELVVEARQVATTNEAGTGVDVICGVDDCGAENGSIRIGQVTPPTATRTPSVLVATATRTPTFTPTMPLETTSTPTSTPTIDEGGGTPTSTPTGTTAVAASPTNTRVPTTPPVVASPTNTIPVQATATATPTSGGGGGQGEFDDSCAIVPLEQSSPFRSLILLVGPALLLWGRRRRS